MARLRILPLPGDGQPFALVIDRADDYTLQLLAFGTTLEADGTQRPTREHLKDTLGARAVLVFEQDIELVVPATGTEHLRERADELDQLQCDLGFPVRSHGEPVTLNAEQYRAADVANGMEAG